MGFADAIKAVLGNYAGFSGRARRSEYWYWFLFVFILDIVAVVLDAAINSPILQIVVGLGLLIPGLAVGFRRLHDTGRSAWWLLIGLIPLVGFILLIVWFCEDSGPDNQYGPNPKTLSTMASGGYGTPPPPSYGTPPAP